MESNLWRDFLEAAREEYEAGRYLERVFAPLMAGIVFCASLIVAIVTAPVVASWF